MEFDKDVCKVNNAHGIVVAEARMSMFERRTRMWQSLQMKELRFGTKDSATSTWRAYEVGENGRWHEFERSAIAPCM